MSHVFAQYSFRWFDLAELHIVEHFALAEAHYMPIRTSWTNTLQHEHLHKEWKGDVNSSYTELEAQGLLNDFNVAGNDRAQQRPRIWGHAQ